MNSKFAEQALNHLQIIRSGMGSAEGFIELRTFDEKDKSNHQGRNIFIPVDADVDSLNGAVKWLTAENKRGRGVFVGVNPRTRESGTKKDITQLTTAFLDLDLEKRGITREDAIAEIEELSPVKPDLITDTGGGLHVLYFMQPTGSYDNWRDLQETLYSKFEHLGADRAVVTDSSRVLRLTPFQNWKYDGEAGRSTEIVEFNVGERRPSIASFNVLFDVKPKVKLEKLGLAETMPEGGTAQSEGRNTLLFREAAALRNRGYSEDEILSALMEINRKRAVPPLPDEEVERIAASASRYEPTSSLGTSADYDDNNFGYTFGDFVKAKFPDVEWIIHGLNQAEIGFINAIPNIGKDQPLDAKIKMVDGSWKTMGEVALGDSLASIDGQDNRIYGVFPQGKRDVYRLTFSDGRSVEAGADHLWKVHYRNWPTARIFTTRDLKTHIESVKETNRVWIDTVSGHFGSEQPLPIPAYSLGALLGDGGLTNGTPIITTKDPEIIERIRGELSIFGVVPQRIDKISYRLSTKATGKGSNPLTNALRSLNLMGTNSSNKFIPREYLDADRDTRIALMQGLIDTDGFVGLNRSVDYSTVSPQLARDVQELARSLGAVAKISTKSPYYRGRNGHKVMGKTSYIIQIRHHNSIEFVRLPRKKLRLLDKSDKKARLTVLSVEFVGQKETQCIAVTHPSRLYVTDDYIVTHNTTLMLNLSMSVATGREFYPMYVGGRPLRVMYMDFENRKGFLQRDLIQMSSNFSEEDRELINENLFIAVDQEIYGSEMNLSNQEHLDLVKAEALNHRADLIIIDTMAAAFTFANENDNSEAEKVVIKPLKSLARETNAAVLLVHHIGKAGETGDRSKLYSGRGASAFAAAARLVMNMEALKDGNGRPVKNHVVLSAPKVKGKAFDDTVFELDFPRRWFDAADIVLPDETSRQEQIWAVIDRPMKRQDVIAALLDLGHDVSDSTVSRALRLGVATGKIRKGITQGTYIPIPRDAEVEAEVIEGDAETPLAFTVT